MRDDIYCSRGTIKNMIESCKKCKGVATWEIEVVFLGPVMPRTGTYYACASCRDEVARFRSSHFRFTKL